MFTLPFSTHYTVPLTLYAVLPDPGFISVKGRDGEKSRSFLFFIKGKRVLSPFSQSEMAPTQNQKPSPPNCMAFICSCSTSVISIGSQDRLLDPNTHLELNQARAGLGYFFSP